MTTQEKLSKYYNSEVKDVDEMETIIHFKVILTKWKEMGVTWKKGSIYSVSNHDGVAHILMNITKEDFNSII